MATKGFIKLPSKDKKYITLPANIFEDDRLSIGAKGLYTQLYYSNERICTFEDLLEVTTSTKEDIQNWYNELIEIGYLVVEKDKKTEKTSCTLVMIPKGEKTVAKKLDKKSSDDFFETTTEEVKTDSLHTRIVKLIESYSLDSRINNLLIEFFDHWIFREGRYSETGNITETRARELINDLISFELTVEESISCIKYSISKEYYNFFNPKKNKDDKPEISPEEKLAKINGIITTRYEFSKEVNELLSKYFRKYVYKEGRFGAAEELHSRDVYTKLNTLRDFDPPMSDEEKISCIQQSIDKENFVFYDTRSKTSTTSTKSTFKAFDKTTLTSGSYTEEDIKRIKEQAEAMNEEGKKGIF